MKKSFKSRKDIGLLETIVFDHKLNEKTGMYERTNVSECFKMTVLLLVLGILFIVFARTR